MKIEIGESLGYSYLRHVKRCWLVQANWKVSDHWDKHKTDAELETMFLAMKQKFDRDGNVFKKTRDAAQFLSQGEIDVVGVDQKGGIHAMEVAFHEAGLNYGGGADNRVLKKLLRTVMILNAYHSSETKLHIYFVSPKVNPGVQKPLEDAFALLEAEYPEIDWNLIINEDFTDHVVRPTLEKADTVADTSELFVRAAKLLELTGIPRSQAVWATSEKVDTSEPFGHAAKLPGLARMPETINENTPTGHGTSTTERGLIQPIVRNLMKTLLEDWPTLLDEADRRNLMNSDYCKNNLGLKISNLALLHRIGAGRAISGHDRYYEKPYAGQFYVCKEWWKKDHLDNARSLLRFVTNLTQRELNHPGIPALERHQKALRDYVG